MERMQNSKKPTRYRKKINRKEISAIDAHKKLNNIFSSKKSSIKIKLRTFTAYVASVFLYNSELWTLTKKLENTIETFQRIQLKKILGIIWQEILLRTIYIPERNANLGME